MSLSSLLLTGAPSISDRALVLANGEGQVVSVTFGTLKQACNDIREKLKVAGLASGDVVGLVSPHSVDTATILVGLATSGLTCAPMDPSTSSQRFEKILKETGTKLLLVSGLFFLAKTWSFCTFYEKLKPIKPCL